MEDNESLKKCTNCGQLIATKARFCTYCGTRLPESILRIREKNNVITDQIAANETEIAEESEIIPIQDLTSHFSKYCMELLVSLKKNFSNVLILVGGLSVIAAITLTIIFLMPKEFIPSLEMSPITGMMFDILVATSLLTFIIKEVIVLLGYISKKQSLDRWFSFVIILFCWTNLVTLSLGLVQTSIFYQLGGNIDSFFVILSLTGFLVGIFYYIRFREPLFSGTFITIIMSILYLVQWLTPFDPLFYTNLIFITTVLIILTSLKTKDLIPFIGTTFLLPIIFLSPYLLSNSSVILILVLLVSFPFTETVLSSKIITSETRKNKIVKAFGETFSSLGMMTITFSVFYGYIPIKISFFLLAIPTIGLIILKIISKYFQRVPLKDFMIIINLIFSNVFFDLISNELVVLWGIAAILVIYSSFTFFDYSDSQFRYLSQYSLILLLASLVVISLIQITFPLKISILLIPSLILLFLFIRGKKITSFTVQGVTFGTSFLVMLSFIQNPIFIWQIIPLIISILAINFLILFIFDRKAPTTKYSLDIVLLTLIFEINLIAIMLWTKTHDEMLYPVFILIILMVFVSIIQTRRRLSINYLWINATYLLCLGVFTFWNEYEATVTLLTSVILTLPLILEVPFSTSIPEELLPEIHSKNFNLKITLSALGLTFIVFFEKLDPITHGLLFLIIPIIWTILYTSKKQYFNLSGGLFLISLPFIIFLLELLLNQTIFTPITKIDYLIPSLAVLILPTMVLQAYRTILRSEAINLNPAVIGTTFYSLTLTIAFMCYDFKMIEARFLVFSWIIACVLSVLLVKWQYEAIGLLVTSFLPSLICLDYLLLPVLVSYLIPLFPIMLNCYFSIRSIRKSISIKIHEILMLIYLVLNLFVNPINLTEYSAMLTSVFLVSWYIIQLKHLEIDQTTLNLFNILNTVVTFILVLFIDSKAPENIIFELDVSISQNVLLISMTITFMLIAIMIQLVSKQIVNIKPQYSYLITIEVLVNFSSFILLYSDFVIRQIKINSENIVFSILIGMMVLLVSSIITFTKIKSVKPHLSIAIMNSSAIWLLFSSIYFNRVDNIFLWLFFAPIFLMIFLSKKESTIALSGIIYYISAGIVLIEKLLSFILYEESDWLAIFFLIIYGVELISLGIYSSSLSKRSNEVSI